MGRSLVARTPASLAVMLVVAVVLLASLEGAVRVVLRVATGRWPATRAARIDDARRATSILYRRHPFLLTAPREGARDPRGERIVVNSLGYRSPERPRGKPVLHARVVCAGGSTTWDPWAVSNDVAWPSLLEKGLRARGRTVEVWNGGFPGWTSLENLIALSIRDLELRPDVVVLYQGINDLQPASHVPVEPDYGTFHAAMQTSLLGFDVPPLPWYERLVLVDRVRRALFGPITNALTGRPERAHLRRALHPDGVRIFERNVRSFIAVARAHGARVVLVTQHLQRRRRHGPADDGAFTFAVPDLAPDTARRELDRLNGVLRALAHDGEAELADVARDVAWTDADFHDVMHTSGTGSRKLADAIVEPVLRALDRR